MSFDEEICRKKGGGNLGGVRQGDVEKKNGSDVNGKTSAISFNTSLGVNGSDEVGSSGSSTMTNVSPVDIVVAVFDYATTKKNQLALQQGDTIYVLNKKESGWWDGLLIDTNNKVNRGWFPQNFTRSLNSSNSQTQQGQTKQQQKQKQLPQMHQFAVGGKKWSQIRQNLSNQSSRRSSLPQQHPTQISPTQRRLSLSTISPSRNITGTHNSSLQSKSKNQPHRSPSLSKSSSIGSSSMSPFNFHFSSNDTQHVNKGGSDIASISQSRYNSLSGPSSSAGSHMGSNIATDPRYSKKQHYQQQQATERKNDEKINILSIEEIEMVFNSLHSEVPPIWSPVPTTSMDRVVYYNKDLNIYCNQLPLLSNSSLDNSSDFRADDNLVDLYPRDFQNSSKSIDSKMFKLVPSYTGRNSVTSKNSSLSSSTAMQTPFPPNGKRSNSASTTNSNSFHATSENQFPTFSHSQSGKTVTKFNSIASTEMDSVMHSHRKTKLPSMSSSYSKHSHRSPQAILSKPDLFYHHTMDIKLWSELRDSTLYYVTKTHQMLLRNNRLEYEKYFGLVSAHLTYTQMACRLTYAQIKEKQLLKEVKRILRKIINSLSRISINSSIYFGSFHRSSSTLNDTPRPSEASLKQENVQQRDDLYQNANVTDTDTLIGAVSANPSFIVNQGGGSVNDVLTESSVTFQRNNSATTTRTSVPSIQGDHCEPTNPSVIVKSLYETLDVEFNHFSKAIQTLYLTFERSILSNDWIPQLFPRFFKGSFNGGAWNNPFDQVNPSLESVSSHFSLATGLPSNVAEAIAGITGCTTGECAEACKDFDFYSPHSRDSKSNQSSQKMGTISGFSRPSHHRTFSRSKASRKIQYPLNENTVLLMKKRFFLICEKLGNIKLFEDSTETHGIMTSKRKQLEVISETYGEVSSCILLEVLENLDLGIFVNLKSLIANKTNIDPESGEFLRHAFSTISSLLTEFFDLKQVFHDSVVKLIMSAQQITLNDPYVFCSMKSKFPVGYFEPGLNLSQSQFNRIDKNVMELCSSLISKDVEINHMALLETPVEFIDCCTKYTQIANASCIIVEQLVEARENLLNYAARMMKNDLTAELLEGEQQKWFEDYKVFENDDEDGVTTEMESGVEFQGNDGSKSPDDSLKDKPWFLQSEFTKSLTYDQRGRIKGGTREALIEHLTSHEVIDAGFNVTMLLTFRSMFTTRDFLYSLVYRYNLHPPEGLSYDEYNLWIEKKLAPIKCRVINIMKSLFSQYWTPAYYEPGISTISNFAQIAVEEHLPGAEELYEEIKENIATKGAGKGFSGNAFVSPLVNATNENNMRAAPSLPFIPSPSTPLKLKKFKLLDIDPRIYASQLTLMEHSLYIRIPVFECLDRAWGTKYCDMGGSPNITKFISSANHLTNYVSYAIVREVDVKKRISLIQYFITVAQYCRELNNFSAMTAIVSALCSSPIYRLKKTWPHVNEECTKHLKDLNNLMDSTKNFINYRELARSVKDVPCVPFFGVYLSDLTFTVGGNPDFLHNSSDIINFGKRTRIVDILEEIMSFKRIHYKLKHYDDIQAIIEGSLENVPHIEKQYELSLFIEPRTDDQGRPSAVNPIKGTVLDSKSGSDDRNVRLLKFGKKKHSSRLF